MNATPTPNTAADPHEQRIAELRTRRRARMRKLALRSGLGTLALVLLGAVLLVWLLTTVGGRDVLLHQIVARLPAGTTLTWQSAEGPASGPLRLHGVRLAMPRQLDTDCVATATTSCAKGTIVFTARTLVLDPALRPLLGRRLRLDALDISGATLSLPRDDTPFKWPRWPESLPQIAPPLSLRADRIRIDDMTVTRAGAPLLKIAQARGGLDAQTGRLHVEQLRVDSDRGRFTLDGDYAPRDDDRMDLTATAVLPGSSAPRLGLVARGDLSSMVVAISGNAPKPVRAQLRLHDTSGGDAPSWTLSAQADALDPSLLSGSGTPGTPLAFKLDAHGVGGDAQLQGSLKRDTLHATLQPSHVQLADQVLVLQPLVLDVLDGRITARGRVDLRQVVQGQGRQMPIRLALNARGLRWGNGTSASAVLADAEVGIAGTPDAWAAIGKASLHRGQQAAQLRFDGRGDRMQVAVRSLHVAMPSGALDATGQVHWSPALAWTLDARLAGFDPGYFAPAWDGAVDGRIASHGAARDAGGFDADVDVSKLGGRLRGRPLSGHATLALHDDADPHTPLQLQGEVALVLGASHVDAHGRIGASLDVDARFSPLQLHDLLPDGTGTLRGSLTLRGPRLAPDIAAELDGEGLAYGDWRAASLHAHGRLPWRGGGGALTVDAVGLALGIPFDALHLDARGMVEHLQLQGDAHGTLGKLAFAGDTDRNGGLWRGNLSRLQLQPERGADWQLRAPTHFVQTRNGWSLSQACLASSAGGSVCASGDWPGHGIDVQGQGLPLALLVPYLPERSDGRPWLLHGEVALVGNVRAVGNAWRGQAKLQSAEGGLRNSERARHDLFAYSQLRLDARFDPQRIDATLTSAIAGNGHVDAHIDSGWDANAALRGTVALDTSELTWMELLSPDIVEPTGHLSANLSLDGNRAQPSLDGQAQLSGFATELPALAISISEGTARLQALPDGTARIDGSLRTGPSGGAGTGLLRIDGSLGWRGGDTPLVLNVRGDDVLVSDTRDLRAVVDPDVVVRYRAGAPIDVTGKVGVPSARIDLERLDQGVKTSPDVVVLDPANPERKLATPVQLDLTLALGDDVKLNGFGLDGTLAGDLRVRSQPGSEMRASGTLEVGGRYTAYGQKLDITRGELAWSNDPIADPLLDIRAQRDVGEVTAGIDVTGRASRPQAEVWTDPATDSSQALAYLALGRPLSSASDDESRQLDAASAALSAGGSLLASELGARLGLDNAGVSDSRALGGSVLGIGKYLSPRLYVGYGVSLLGTGQVLTLKYLLRKGFDIQVESSTVENRASINWRKER